MDLLPFLAVAAALLALILALVPKADRKAGGWNVYLGGEL